MDIKHLLMLFVVGVLGILANAFKKMNEINKSLNGKFVFHDYLMIERFNIAGAFIGVLLLSVVPYFGAEEIDKYWKWLWLPMFAMGWFGLSILEFMAGQAKRRIGEFTQATDEDIRKIQNP